MFRVFASTVAALLCSAPVVSSAQVVLTFEEVISRVRDHAAPVAIARARVAEAAAVVVGASTRMRDNPVIEAAVGPRRSSGAGIRHRHRCLAAV